MLNKETKLAKVLKRLEKAGYKVLGKLEIESDVEFLGDRDIICQHDAKFVIRYFKDGHFTLETSWSNQLVTDEWVAELKKLRLILK